MIFSADSRKAHEQIWPMKPVPNAKEIRLHISCTATKLALFGVVSRREAYLVAGRMEKKALQVR